MNDTHPSVDIGEIVAAIAAASHDIADLNARVAALEQVNRQAEEENERLRGHLAAVLPKVEASKSELRAATSAADEAESRAAGHLGRADRLSEELAQAHEDLTMIEAATRKLMAHG